MSLICQPTSEDIKQHFIIIIIYFCQLRDVTGRAQRPEPRLKRQAFRQPAAGGRHSHATVSSSRRCLVLCQKSIKPLTAQNYPAATGVTSAVTKPRDGTGNGSGVGRTFRKHVAARSSAKHELRLATRSAAHQHRTDPSPSIIYRLARGSKSVIYSQTLTCTVTRD